MPGGTRGRLPRVPPVVPAAEELRDGRHSRWDDHREERRRLILDAAIAVVEEQPAGADLTLQDVSERAGLVRTVVQRHFGGRVTLVRAVQADVLAQAFTLITGPVDYSGTLREVATGLVSEAVDWVATHRELHAFVERELGDGDPSELGKVTETYAEYLVQMPMAIAAMRGIVLAPVELEEIRLMFAGIIGQVRATVRHWAGHGDGLLDAGRVVDVLVQAITSQVAERSRQYGLDLDVDVPLLGSS